MSVKDMKQIDITLMKEQGDKLFAFSSNDILSPRKQGQKQKTLGDNLTSLTDFHKEIFNVAKSEMYKGQEIAFNVNGNLYAVSKPEYSGLLVNKNFPKEEIEKFSNRNNLDFKSETTMIGLFKAKRTDSVNLYNNEEEKYIRDKNGFTDFTSKEELIKAIEDYMENDPNQNSYHVQRKDLSVVSLDGEHINDYRDRKPTVIKNKLEQELKAKQTNRYKR